MKVELLHSTPLWICAKGIRRCWDSGSKSDTFTAQTQTSSGIPIADITFTGEKDKELIDRVGNKFKHASTLEHLVYNFDIEGISRACLQELARHRIASLSVKSTRYTLKELKKEEEFLTDNYLPYLDDDKEYCSKGFTRASDYIVMTGEELVDFCSLQSLEFLRKCLVRGVSNDKAKYCLPESYKTSLAWTINARSLQNFLSLRMSKSALWEIRELAHKIYTELPTEHKYLFVDCMQKEDK